MFRTLKVKRSQKFVGWTQNPKKIIETLNQHIRTKFFPNMYVICMFRTLKVENLESLKTIGLKLSSKKKGEVSRLKVKKVIHQIAKIC
jgi:hypothetical protein